jgi:hypothetical protein
MRRAPLLIASCVWFLAESVAFAWQGEATPPVAPRRVDYKVVVWYRRDRPIETFRHQVYDVRKGEYSRAVDDWINMMKAEYPGYLVYVREVDLDREFGPSEARKVGAVVHRELLAAAASIGVFVGPLAPPVTGLHSYQPYEFRSTLRPVRVRPPYSRLFPLFNQNPTPVGFPVPIPYPRPHP